MNNKLVKEKFKLSSQISLIHVTLFLYTRITRKVRSLTYYTTHIYLLCYIVCECARYFLYALLVFDITDEKKTTYTFAAVIHCLSLFQLHIFNLCYISFIEKEIR